MTTRFRHAAMATAATLAALLFTTTAAFAATDTVEPAEPEPVLVVRSFKTTPATLSVGGKFKLEILLDNVVDVDADNVVVTVGASSAAGSASSATSASASGNTPEVVVMGTNTRYVTTIAGKATNYGVSFDLISNPKGFPGPYSLPVTIQFDNPNGGRVTSVQSVGLMFTRNLVFDVGALSYPRETTVGAPFHVSVSVKNTNDFRVNGVSLSFDATGTDWVSRETTVGTMEPGTTGKLDATGIAQTPGIMTVTMTLSYKDDYNVTKTIKRDFVVRVAPKPVVQPQDPSRTSPGRRIVLFVRALLGLGG